MSQISFTVYAVPQPQGSIRAFAVKGQNRAVLTSTNKKLKPFRGEVCQTARWAMNDAQLEEPFAGKHVPVSVVLEFSFPRPPSVPKRRKHMVVKPDIDKLERAVLDACKGVLWFDDGQVVEVTKRKRYGAVAEVHVSARVVTEDF
jgi:crossover junction endodeoxyribonuclease RusA